MGRVKRSIIALILTVSMLLSIFPINLSAAEGEAEPSETLSDEDKITEEGYLKGQLKLVIDGREITEMVIGEGEKEYVYTELLVETENNVKYTWQILINEESNSWATINDYLLSYAVISEALIENQPNEDGHATIRCIADDGENKYVSGNLEIAKRSDMMLFSSPALYSTGDAEEPEETETEGEEPEKTETEGEEPEGEEAGGVENDSVAPGNANAFNIVINYVFRHGNNKEIDNTTASSTFTVTLPKTASYTGTVTTPHVTGYTPYILDDEKGHFEYFDHKYTYAGYYSFENQHTDITVTIYYIPNIVNYTVKYYEQNLYDDEYTYAGFVVKTGYADTPVGEGLAVNRDGFKALAYDKDEVIADDGEGVVEIYYDRLYCLVDIDLVREGAHGVVPYYVRYKTQIILGTPTCSGYTFRGWELTKLNDKTVDGLSDTEKIAWDAYAVGSIAGTMLTLDQAVATKLLYTAKWETATTTYSAIYWVENANDTGYTLWGYKVYDARPGDVVSAKDDMEREDKECFTFNEHRSDKNITVEGDGTTAVNVYYTRNYYSLVFKAGSTCYAQEHTHGTDCVRPLICGNDTTHKHSEDCIRSAPICKYEEHIHSDSCKDSCKIPPHPEHNDSCLACTKEEHDHTWKCYNGATSETSGNTSVSGQAQDGYIGRSGFGWWGGYTYWIYVKGTWYKYSGDVEFGSYATPNSRVCPGEHTHSDENKCYKDEIHIHNEFCCSIPEHIHDENACYEYSCGLKQHSHENCYGECILYEHTHNNEGNTKILKVITAKYGADISSEWPIKAPDESVPYSEGNRWDPDSNASTYTEVLVYIPFMPGEDITFTANAGSANKIYTMNYYLEALPGATDTVTFEGKQYVLNNSIKAKYNHLTYAEDFFDITGFTQYKVESGGKEVKFTSGKLELSGSNITVNLYYSRNEYEIVHNNNGIVIDHESHISKYQASISNHGEDPEYPSNMEPGACHFDGWYYTPTCAVGTEVDFDHDVMPAGDLVIYSKWSPEQYDVKVYMDNTLKNILLDTTVYFNEMVVEPMFNNKETQAPEPGDMPQVIPDTYIFAGWYYMDGEVEKRFDFNTMMIKRDYVIYAKWTSMVPVKYVIKYCVKHADGTLEEIAKREEGEALIGITKTFSAKTGDQLYSKYKTGYYPGERSASIQMNADETQNVYTFIYEHQEKIHYTLIHTFTDNPTGIESSTGTDKTTLASILGISNFSMSFEYTITNASDTAAELVLSFRERVTEENIRNAIKKEKPEVTEQQLKDAWNFIKNFSPDAYERRLILERDHSDGSNNMNFEWALRTNNYLCQVVQYTQDLDASEAGTNLLDDYTRVANSGIFMYSYDPNSDNVFSTTCPEIIGFHVNPVRSQCKTENGQYVKQDDLYVCAGTPTQPTVGDPNGGLIIRIYYDRNMLSYKVKHVAGDYVYEETKGPVRYGTTVTEFAKDVTDEAAKEKLDKYYVQGDPQKSAEILQDGHIITFGYRLHIISYYYQIVGGGEGASLKGKLSKYNEDVDANSTPEGSIPTPAEGYVFAGWFKDKEGTIPVTEEDANIGALNNTIIPIPSADKVGIPQYFYAKFIPTHIVIQNNNVKNENHTFIYRLRGAEGTNTEAAGVDLVFAIVGNGSITISNLPDGRYVLTTNTDWAYRYDNESQIVFDFYENKIVWVDYHTESGIWLGDYAYSQVP